MEKERGYKVVAIVALLIAIVGVGIGFAAFSATFTIEEETVTVNPSENLLENGMHFTGVIDKWDSRGTNELILNPGTATERSWSNISLKLNSGTDDAIQLVAEIKNESNYDAYVTGLSTAKTGSNTPNGELECIAAEGTNQALVDNYCSKSLAAVAFITNLNPLDPNYDPTAEPTENDFAIGGKIPGSYNSSTFAVEYMPINVTEGYRVAAGESVYLYLVFDEFNSDIVPTPDGPFTVYIPTINFEFSTAKPAQTN